MKSHCEVYKAMDNCDEKQIKLIVFQLLSMHNGYKGTIAQPGED
jgi:hypothetical protein